MPTPYLSSVCFSKAQAHSLPSQAASRVPILVHQVNRCLLYLLHSLWEPKKVDQVHSAIHIKEMRQRWGSPCGSFHALFRLWVPGSHYSCGSLFPPLSRNVALQEGFLKSPETIKFSIKVLCSVGKLDIALPTVPSTFVKIRSPP